MKKLIPIAIVSSLFSLPALAQADDFDVVAAWQKDCSKCHADDGSGLTKKGRKLRLKDYRKAEVQAEMPDEEIVEAIKHGVTKDGEELMNPYGEDYTDEQIQAFLAYVRSLAVKS